MIRNYKGVQYDSLGIDLNNFDIDEMIKRFSNVEVTGINVLLLIYKQRSFDFIERIEIQQISQPKLS